MISNKQKQDLETIKYFIPNVCRNIHISNNDVNMFFEYSEKGLHKNLIKQSHFTDGFNALIQGKIWRGRHMEMWEEGILDASVPYITLLGGYENSKKWWQFWKSEHRPILRSVVDFMKKEMFQGTHSEIIESVYKQLTL